MPIPVEELIQYTQFTWSSILEVDVEQIHEEFKPNPDTDINACVLISGTWKGMVVMSFHLKLAQAVAIKMFDLKNEKPTDEHLIDAVGEMINMIGGNLKALVPQPSFLSLPIVSMNGHSILFPSTEEVCKSVFNCKGQQFRITVLESKEKSFLRKSA
jgi:chemotaxis protein CheX